MDNATFLAHVTHLLSLSAWVILQISTSLSEDENRKRPRPDTDPVREVWDDYLSSLTNHAIHEIHLLPDRNYGVFDDRTGERRPRKKRIHGQYDWERARDVVVLDYMSPMPMFNDRQFERMFRITRSMTEELMSGR